MHEAVSPIVKLIKVKFGGFEMLEERHHVGYALA
jgi:hypothetical protein